MKPIEDIRVARLKQIKDERAWSIQQLADGLEKSHSQVSQLLNRNKHSTTGKPRSIGSDLAREIEQRLGLPAGWMDSPGTDVQESSDSAGLDQPVSLPTRTMDSPSIEWGMLMHKLPKAFKVAAPDDAMAPEWRRGEIAEFEAVRPDLQPMPGDIVLVRNADRVALARRYNEPVAGRWEATPDAKGYRAYWSDEHQLEVLAIFFGVRRRSGSS